MKNRKTILSMVLAVLVAVAACKPQSGGMPVPSVCNQPTGETFIGLEREGSTGYIYNNEGVQDPLALCSSKGALVTSVTNPSGFNLSLAHGGPGAPFIILAPNASTTAFSGTSVAGNWSAQVGGNIADLPSSVTVEVEWRRP